MCKAVVQLGVSNASVIGGSAGGALALMVAIRYSKLVSNLVLVGSSGLGKEVPPFIKFLSVPIVGNVLQSHRFGGNELMLQRVLLDRSLVSQNLVDEMRRTRSLLGAKETVKRIQRQAVTLSGVRDEFVLVVRLRSLGIGVDVCRQAEGVRPTRPLASHGKSQRL